MMQFTDEHQVADKYWEIVCSKRKRDLLTVLMADIDTEAYRETPPTEEQTSVFLHQLVEAAWKSGFVDCLWTVSSGALTIADVEKN